MCGVQVKLRSLDNACHTWAPYRHLWIGDIKIHFSARQHQSYDNCLEVKREYYQNCFVLEWIVWHNVHSQQHTYMSSSYRSNGLGLSHWVPSLTPCSCLELYYCNMVEWFWWDSSLISTTNWFPSVLWHCWFGHLACKNCPRNDL